MKIHVLVASALALSLAAPVAANALTIDNRDKVPYALKVQAKGGKATDVDVKASSTATIDCKNGCTLTLGKLTEKVDGKATKILIKDGKFVM